MQNKQKGFSVVEGLVLILVIGVIGFAVYTVMNSDDGETNPTAAQSDTMQNKEQEEDTAPDNTPEKAELVAGNFSAETEIGTFQARGYVTVMVVDDVQCTVDCSQEDVVMFNIIETPNDDVLQYTSNNKDNAFVGESSISIGCRDADGIIGYSNNSDEFGFISQRLTSASEQILGSSEDEPVDLEFTKYALTGGGGAPLCYSHFHTVTLLGNS